MKCLNMFSGKNIMNSSSAELAWRVVVKMKGYSNNFFSETKFLYGALIGQHLSSLQKLLRIRTVIQKGNHDHIWSVCVSPVP